MANNLFDHPNIKVFKQHGFIPQGTSGKEQVMGRCPFCGENKHFYINIENKRWDCKVCFKEGGYQKFLQQIMSHTQKKFKGSIARALAKRRGFEVETLKHHGVGYNPLNDTYLIPVWDVKGKEVYNIRIYKRMKELHNSSGMKAALYGWEGLDEGNWDEVWILEGEWDKMAWWEVLTKSGNLTKKVRIVGVPGAGTFKPEWCGFFKGKKVHVLYDNDHDKVDEEDGTAKIGAGRLGARKVFNLLNGVAGSIDFVHWPLNYNDGFDVNDYYVKKKKCNAKRAFKGICSMLKPKPQPSNLPEDVVIPGEEEEDDAPLTGAGLKPEEVYDGYRQWLHLPDPTVLDMLFGCVIANRLAGRPLWMFLVGPSSSGKSELIMSLNGCPKIYPISSLTTKTLISGSLGPGGSDPSLAAKLDGKILAIKDMTEIFSMNSKDREVIFGQLRDLYDGEAQKPFGTGVEKKYDVKFGLIAGMTDAVELFTEHHTALGERYVRAPITVDRSIVGEKTLMKRAFENLSSKDNEKMQDELRLIAGACLNHEFGEQPKMPQDIVNKMMSLAQWLARMRGTVQRDSYTKEITHLPFVEMPTRIFIQLSKWVYGITLFRRKKEVTENEYLIMRDIAISSAPKRQEIIVRKMYNKLKRKGSYGFSESDFVKMTGLPVVTCKQLADALTILRVFDKNRAKRGLGYDLQLSDECIGLIEEANIY